MPSNQDNGWGGAKLPFRAMQKVVSEVGGLNCTSRGPKKGNFTASIKVWIHYKLAFTKEIDAKPCSWSSGYGPWKFRCRLPGVAIQDLGSPWSNHPSPSPSPSREGSVTLSLVISSLLQENLESLCECFWVAVNVLQQLVISHPWKKKNLIFCYKDSTTQVSVLQWSSCPPKNPEPAGFLSSSVKVTGLSWYIHNHPPFSVLWRIHDNQLNCIAVYKNNRRGINYPCGCGRKSEKIIYCGGWWVDESLCWQGDRR